MNDNDRNTRRDVIETYSEEVLDVLVKYFEDCGFNHTGNFVSDEFGGFDYTKSQRKRRKANYIESCEHYVFGVRLGNNINGKVVLL
jgi:hypothetical protein